MKKIGILLLALISTGCFFNSSEPDTNERLKDLASSEPTSQERASARIGVKELPNPRELSDLKITWDMSSRPVDGYVIYYGFDADNLLWKEKVAVSDLGKFEDPSLGFVYKYVLKNVPANKTIVVSVAPYVGDETLEASEPFTVQSGFR